MIEVAQGWRLDAAPTGDWLVLRIGCEPGQAAIEPALAESIWPLAERHTRVHLAIELDGAVPLTSLLIGQLLLLHKRAHLNGGALRLCGLSAANERILRLMGLAERLPSYPTLEAVLARDHPHKPR